MFTQAVRQAVLVAGVVVVTCSAHAQSPLSPAPLPQAGEGSKSKNSQPLSLDAALLFAQARSQQLVAQDAAANAARSMSVAAGQRPDPIFKAGINNLPINGTDRFSLTRDFMTMRSIGVAQELTREGKRLARTARFEREAEVAEAGRAVALANLRRETALAWLERHFQERMREALQTQRSETALQIDAAEAAYRGGRGAQADVFAARSAVAQIDDRVRVNALQIAAATERLGRWIGAQVQAPLAAPPNMGGTPLDSTALVGDSLQTRLEHHPQIALLVRQEAVARAEADIVQSQKQSDWSAELMFSQRGPAYSNMLSLNVSIPLQWEPKNRQDRELAARLALIAQLQAQREEALREHVAETRNLLRQWQGLRDRLVQFDRTLVPLAAERTRAAGAAYRGGGGGLGAVLEARRAEIDVRIERLRLEMETASLWAQLEYLDANEHSAPETQRPAAVQGQQP